MVTASQLVKPSVRFQRAIHLRYDLGDPSTIDRYVPTLTAADAIYSILQGTQEGGTQRAHVLHAAYGSGKSLLAVSLVALLEKSPNLSHSVHQLIDRLIKTDQAAGELAAEYMASDKHLLPVVLSSNEGDLNSALLKALARCLASPELSDIQLTTKFDAALATLYRWNEQYPKTFQQLADILSVEYKQKIIDLIEALKNHENAAFDFFERLYPQLTAGAQFNLFAEQSAEIVYRDVAQQLTQHGYNGILVIWDEFGRYLEARASQAFSEDAAQLQNFAEVCNYSGQNQIHFLLFTHKELQGYASALPKSYQQEWSRIEGRFQKHNITTDPYIAYRLIGNAIQHTEVAHQWLSEEELDNLTNSAADAKLFGILPRESVRDLIHDTWPLHPLMVFALAHLSSRVAQNERTMFTFLTTDEPKALYSQLDEIVVDQEAELVYSSALWDYFEDAIRGDSGGSGAHRFWSGVAHALDKVAPGDVLAEKLVKTIGVLSICAETTHIRPTTELLAWGVGAKSKEQYDAVIATLENLRRRKVLINRQIDGYWSFIFGSDINFEQQITDVLARINPTPLQLRRLLEDRVPAPFTLARRYNQERAMTRYFTGIYRWADEIEGVPWDLLLKELRGDGIVVYVLATDDLALQQANRAIQEHPLVIYVLPQPGKPLLSLNETLQEVFGLLEISNDPILKQHEDRDRIQREVDWLIEDAEARLERLLSDLVDSRQGNSIWATASNGLVYEYTIRSPGQASKLVSDLCQRIFHATPIFNSEGLNKNQPSAQQLKAAQKLIDAMFSKSPSDAFGMEGNGPEILASNALLKLPGILRKVGDMWEFGSPEPEFNHYLHHIWQIIESYFDSCVSNNPQPVEALIEQLTTAPFGLRIGVLPVLLAAVLRSRLMVTTIRRDKRPVNPISGEVIIDIVANPSHFSIEISEWNATLEQLWNVLWERFRSYIHDSELDQQPLPTLVMAMLRWLQNQPSFCRLTTTISIEAVQFRNIIRDAQTEPAKALFIKLPALLRLDEEVPRQAIMSIMDGLMAEVSNAYLDLQRRLDIFAINEFGNAGWTNQQDAATIFQGWLSQMKTSGRQITDFRFGSLMTQNFISVVMSANAGENNFWDRVSEATLGIHLRDWNDNSEERFYKKLRDARDEIVREISELVEEEAVISIRVQIPRKEQQDYLFRASDLSAQGKRLLQNFKSTLEIAGRPLSVDEKRQIAVAFLSYVMGDELSGS
jgi:hypothetical protein